MDPEDRERRAHNHQTIAAETGLPRRYVSRIMQLAFLAPDITEAILEGRQPPQLTPETLRDTLPADWTQQRNQLLKLGGMQMQEGVKSESSIGR
jgi:site-specific DNA recombinase